MTDHFARLAAGQACLETALHFYLPLGFSVTCCCDPDHVGVGRKHAKTCDSPGKTPMHPWKALQTQRPTATEIEQRWRDFPYGNVGCVLGQASGLVRIDVDGATGETLLQQWSHGDLPPTWAFYSSAQGRGLLYTWPRDLLCKSTSTSSPGDHKELRLMGNGSQTILPPSRHASGSLYTWEAGCGPQDIPLAPAPTWLIERLCHKPPRHRAQGGAGQDDTFARVASALAAITNTDAPYDDWLLLGMALHSTGAPWARDLWDSWSRQNQKFDDTKQEKSWESFSSDGQVTIGSLFHLAQQAGWRPPRRARLQGRVMPDMTGHHTAPPTPYGDLYNAEQFARFYGNDFRYCERLGGWFWWCRTHWRLCEQGEVEQHARKALRQLGHEAADRNDGELLQHVGKSLKRHSHLTNMLADARSLAVFQADHDAFDVDPWLLNCANGTLDLRSGLLHVHQREEMLTRCLAIPYEADAACPRWQVFLWRIMGGSQPEAFTPAADERAQRLIDFLQRAIGYSLGGDTVEDCLFLLYGSGRNGKSRFLGAIHNMLGPYAKTAQMSSFLHQEKETVRNDLADLQGVRFVSAIEISEGRHLSEGLLKQLTGSDRIKARFLFHEYFEFLPQFKLFLAFNHKPEVRGTDLAIWERIKLIPFTVTIPEEERDKHLSTHLRAELHGILAWAVQGCLAWQKDGLQVPDDVRQATEEYREEMDHVGRFIAERCLIGIGYVCTPSQLMNAYVLWCKNEGESPLTQNAFGRELTRRGYHLSAEKRSREGIGIRET